jgi:hypothetical protein
MYKCINSLWNKEELPQQWEMCIIIPIYKKGGETDCSNYRGYHLLLSPYKVLSSILVSRLTSYVDEIIGDLQC